MAFDSRIINITRNCRLKLHQAEARLSAGLAEWVITGESIRELTIAEVLARRAQSAESTDAPFPASEIPGIRVAGIVQDFQLIRAANQYAAQVSS